MANDAKVVVGYTGKPHNAQRSARTVSIRALHNPAGTPRFVIVKGVVTTLKEAADIRDRDPKDLE